MRKYFDYFCADGFRKELDGVVQFLEDNMDNGVSMHTFVPDSAGTYAPYEFLSLFNIEVTEEQKDKYESNEYDIYSYLDEVFDDINGELQELLDVNGIIKDYPYIAFSIGWYDGEIAVIINTKS